MADGSAEFEVSPYVQAHRAAQNGNIDVAIELLRKELNGDELKLNDSQKSEVASIVLDTCHTIFTHDRRAAVILYGEIEKIGFNDYLSRLRIAEGMLEAGNSAHAYETLQLLKDENGLDFWGSLIFSRACEAGGNVLESKIILDNIDNKHSKSVEQLLALAHRYIDLKCFDEASSLRSQLKSLESGDIASTASQLFALEVRYSCRTHAVQPMLALVDTPQIERLEEWILIEAIFEFELPGDQITPNERLISDRLITELRRRSTYTTGAVEAFFHYCSRRRDWVALDAFMDKIPTNIIEGNRSIKLRLFESLYFQGKTTEALAYYDAHFPAPIATQWEAASLLRCLSSAKSWTRAGELLVMMSTKTHWRAAMSGMEHLALLIARKSQVTGSLLAQSNGMHSSKLLRILADDHIIKHWSRTGETGLKPRSISRHNDVLMPRDDVSQIMTPACAIYLCTNKAYFFSVLTFIISFADYYRYRNPKLVMFIFLDQDVPGHWKDAIREVEEKLGFAINVVPEAEFVPSNATYNENYGIFTAGHTLARAAYFRIYAARYLLALKMFDRVLYFDSDIICNDAFLDYFHLPFGDCCLMGRLEEESPEVNHACTSNGLFPGTYINSGVLQFDFKNKLIDGLIEEAIRLAETESDRLIFHDQCAINIAFRGRIKSLDPKYNFFLRPHRPDNGMIESAVFVHFLDRPKPWDVSFHRDYRNIWECYARILRFILTQSLYHEMVVEGNSA